jgi:hypothetical protein
MTLSKRKVFTEYHKGHKRKLNQGITLEKLTIRGNRNLFLTLFLLFIGAHLLLVGTIRIYPFLDTPNHLAIATIYRYYGEPSNQFANYFTIDTFLKPNVFHLFFCGSNLFPTVEFANRVFYCLYVLLFPLSILLVIKKIGGNQWFSLLSFLFLYNINVLYGFNGFIIALPFVMFTFYCMLNYLNKQTVLSGITLAGLLVLLFFMHVLAALFMLLIVFVCSFAVGRRSFSGVVKDCIPALPAIALITFWWYRDSGQYQGTSLASFLLRYYSGEYFKNLYLRGGFLIFDNFRLQEGILGFALALIFSLFVIGLVAMGIFSVNAEIKRLEIKKSFKPILVFMTCSVIIFFLIPDRLPGYSFLFTRFSVFIFISLILIASILFSNGLKKAVPGTICIMCLFHLLLWADYFRDFDKENQTFNKEFFSAISDDKRLAGLMYDYRFRGRSVYDNFTDYYIAWKQGIATTRVIDERSFPVKRKVNADILPPYIEWAGKYNNYDGRYAEMDYVLIRGELAPKAMQYMQNFQLIKRAGKWALYKKSSTS